MSAAPEHFRAARTPVPRLPFSAIVFFAVTGLGGALFLNYTNSYPSSSTAAEPIKAATPTKSEVPVYAVRAVPFEAEPATVGAQAVADARGATAAAKGSRSTETADSAADLAASSEPALFPEADRKFKGFNRFSEFGGASNYMTLTATTFGMSAQVNAPGYFGPEAEGVSAPVPEVSTWFYGVALLALLLIRGLHASWHRHHRRTTNKTDSTRH